MRRKDFEINDLDKANLFLDTQPDGIMATLLTDGTPSARAVNFVRIENDIFFHGARSGEKIEGLGKSASFTSYKSLSLIPSYWSDEKSACPATVFFQSAVVKGIFSLENNLERKAQALQKLMEKLQPEGKYLPFTGNIDFYEKEINYVSIFRITQRETSYKVKLGQNWNQDRRNKIRDLLIQRGTSIDLDTVKQMQNFGLLS
jgi:nitroimidazol reductase NimA-like FMN-containing flavoprotein (pyridoxamine 5'-phosphate oxidase superfamily)